MAEIEPEVSLFPNGIPWLYAVFAIFFVFLLFVIFSPFLLEIDQHIKKFFLRCRCSLRNASHKDKDNIKLKMNHLGGAREILGELMAFGHLRFQNHIWNCSSREKDQPFYDSANSGPRAEDSFSMDVFFGSLGEKLQEERQLVGEKTAQFWWRW